MENYDGQALLRLIDEAVQGGDLRSEEIPQIDLYIDQIVTLFNQHLPVEGDAELPMTKTMIHNYSKNGLIQKIKGKKYSKEHILQMLLIYHMKSTLSMQEIKAVMDALYRDGGPGEGSLCGSYDRFLQTKELLGQKAPDLARQLQEAAGSPQEDPLVALLTLCAASLYLRHLAQGLVEAYFLPQEPKERKKP